VAFAKRLQSSNPNDLAKAVRIYAQDARFAAGGASLMRPSPAPVSAWTSSLSFSKAAAKEHLERSVTQSNSGILL
jgi:hypothetical protein